MTPNELTFWRAVSHLTFTEMLNAAKSIQAAWVVKPKCDPITLAEAIAETGTKMIAEAPKSGLRASIPGGKD